MNRLTKKNVILFQGRMCGKTLFNKIYDKLGHLEDIEEELGCPLEVVFNLLNKEIVVFDRFIGEVLDIRKDGDILCIHYLNLNDGDTEIEPLSNYGKTFKLKEE